MRYLQVFTLLTLMIAFLPGCRKNPLKADVSHIRVNVVCIRYDRELFDIGGNRDSIQLKGLHEKYPEFSELYGYQVIKAGSFLSPEGREILHSFMTDPTTLEIKQMVENQIGDFSPQLSELTEAFRHFRHYFPEKPMPVIYTCLSGFNQSVFTAEGIIGIGLDKYLGADCRFYPELGIPRYKQRRMTPLMIPADVMKAWGMTEFEISPTATTLLDHIIYEGKLLHFTEAMLPETADSIVTGFTKAQLNWCRLNEAQMWGYLVERKLLFSTRQMDIVRYINDGPTTQGFPQESPGRSGVWLGRQIIRSYLKKNPEVTLAQLMADNDYLQILNSSGYSPQ